MSLENNEQQATTAPSAMAPEAPISAPALPQTLDASIEPPIPIAAVRIMRTRGL